MIGKIKAQMPHADLPILPAEWQYAVSRDKGQQFALLKKLMAREDVSEVINACDAGREGELIFRSVYCRLQRADEASLDLVDGRRGDPRRI